jgi:superfamily II DNA/RNA helicase
MTEEMPSVTGPGGLLRPAQVLAGVGVPKEAGSSCARRSRTYSGYQRRYQGFWSIMILEHAFGLTSTRPTSSQADAVPEVASVRPTEMEPILLSPVLLGADVPASSFADLGVPAALVEVLRRRGITEPLPIQAATIADALAGRDVSGKAPTGSGKTLAFALPIAATLSRSAPRRPRALVLAPTRELAGQIAAELTPLLATRSLTAHPFYGGVGFGPQRAALRRGVDVAVACPGRLEDLMSTGDIRLSDVDVVVVDEADRMADMGFLRAVCRILDATPPDRQTLLFSATLDGEVDVLVKRYQRGPVRHEVSARAGEARARHEFVAVSSADRPALCAELVNDEGTSLVFVRTKHGADRVARRLRDAGAAAAAIHGDRTQAQREQTLAAFRSGRVQALVATDVAARGIHVDDVARVIHYDLPADVKDYVHRSGRTARAGSEGTVIAFVTPEQRTLASSLRRGLGDVEEYDGALSGTASEYPPRLVAGAHQAASPTGRRRSHSRGTEAAGRRVELVVAAAPDGRPRAAGSQGRGGGRGRRGSPVR